MVDLAAQLVGSSAGGFRGSVGHGISLSGALTLQAPYGAGQGSPVALRCASPGGDTLGQDKARAPPIRARIRPLSESAGWSIPALLKANLTPIPVDRSPSAPRARPVR